MNPQLNTIMEEAKIERTLIVDNIEGSAGIQRPGGKHRRVGRAAVPLSRTCRDSRIGGSGLGRSRRAPDGPAVHLNALNSDCVCLGAANGADARTFSKRLSLWEP